MSTLEEVPYFTPLINEIARGEEATGGKLGNVNIAPQQLACRTQWLKERLEELQLEIENGGSGGGSGTVNFRFQEDYFVITAQDLVAKALLLTKTPSDQSKIQVVIFGGIEQQPNVDFLVQGQVLSWNSLALDLLLEENTNVVVRYRYS